MISRPDLVDDARFSNNVSRIENVEALKGEIESVLAAQPKAEWLQILEEANVPCSPINNVEDVLNDPQVKARNMVVEIRDPDIGLLRASGNPSSFPLFQTVPRARRHPIWTGIGCES